MRCVAVCGLFVLMALAVWVRAADRGIRVEGKVPEAMRLSESFDPAESGGLFVGVRTFADPAFAEVPFAVDDVVDLAHLFALELELINPRQVVLVLSGEPQKTASMARLEALLAAGTTREPATKFQILSHLQRRGAATGTRGVFVVAFATHGFSDQGRDFLVSADTLHGFIQDTGVKVDIVFDQVARANAPRRLVLLDACRERLASGSRAGQPDPASAMGQALAHAIAHASGQVVLSGTTLGGYSYDDFQQQNGVFSAAVLSGLRGAAPADERHFITARTLADYVDQQVRRWVRANRPGHVHLSQGISSRFEGPAAALPLAVDPAGLQAAATQAERERQDAALRKLRQNLGGPISGAMHDEVVQAFASALSAALREELLTELEQLDGRLVTQRSFAFYFEQNRHRFSPSAPSTSPVPPPPMETPLPEIPKQAYYSLTVRADPADSTIKVMNIVPKYRPGMPLKPGDYDVLVQRQGYHPQRQWVTIADRDVVVDIRLAKEVVQTEPETSRLRKKITNSIGMEFVLILAGEFQMGTPEQELERIVRRYRLYRSEVKMEIPQHPVRITQPFYLGQYEVTQEQWEAVMGENSSKFKGANRPMERVSWEEVQTFIRRLNGKEGVSVYRLPTEAEWEYAARAGSTTDFSFGPDSGELGRYAWYEKNSDGLTHEVGQLQPNAWGLYDMHGNVWEWVQDWPEVYASSPQTDPQGSSSGYYRTARGGSWGYLAGHCRSAYRGGAEPGSRNPDLGFRLLRAAR